MYIYIFAQILSCESNIITFYTNAYSDMFRNLYENLKQFSLEKQLHVFVPSFTNISFLHQNNIKFSVIDYKFESIISQTYGTKIWNRINLIKGTIFPTVLNLYDEFLYCDPDVLWFKSGLNYIKNNCKKDLCFQSDSKFADPNNGSLNAGFFYAKKTKFTVNFFAKISKLCEQSDGRKDDDQTIINKYIHKNNLANKIQRFDRKYIANGIYSNLFEKCKRSRLLEIITLHNNYVRGKTIKIQRAKSCGFWFIKDT